MAKYLTTTKHEKNYLPIYLILVESPAPSKSSLNVIPGPTHITLDWGAPQEGWVTSYKIHVEPAKVLYIFSYTMELDC